MIKLNGLELANEILNELATKSSDKKLRLDIIQVGNDYSSSIYIQKKKEACYQANIETKLWKFNSEASETEIVDLINKLNQDQKVTGILVQLPLPKHMDTQTIISAINPKKDVDMFNEKTFELAKNTKESLKPCLVGAIDALLDKYQISLKNKKIVVVGKGKTGGQPIINWYKKDYDVVALDKNDNDINSYVKEADILITAIGNPNVIDAKVIKKGAAFFDIGISRNAKNKKVCGDIDYEVASQFAQWGTPVPGGIGPLTVVMLIKNLICLSNLQND